MAQNQAYLFLVFTLTGIIIGVLFDFFRILRKSFKTSDILTYIEDVVFWILSGIIVLYNIWYFNDGEIRLFMLLGILIGAMIYAITLSKFVITISTKIINILKNIILIPIKPIIHIFQKIIIFFKEKVVNFVKNGSFFVKLENKRGKIENNGE